MLEGILVGEGVAGPGVLPGLGVGCSISEVEGCVVAGILGPAMPFTCTKAFGGSQKMASGLKSKVHCCPFSSQTGAIVLNSGGIDKAGL